MFTKAVVHEESVLSVLMTIPAVDYQGGSLTIYNWYRHKDRGDRFLMYNNLGNIEY